MSHRVLETDFPLMVPPNPPNMIRSHSRDRSNNSIHRNSTHTHTAERSGPPPYTQKSISSSMTSSAVDWHYQRHKEQQQQQQQRASHGATVTTTTYGGGTLGRSGSLRRAYSESSSGPEDDHKAETEPLFQQQHVGGGKKSQGTITVRPSPVRSQMSTTSDYHSDPQGPDGSSPPTTAGVVVTTTTVETSTVDAGPNGAYVRSASTSSKVKKNQR